MVLLHGLLNEWESIHSYLPLQQQFLLLLLPLRRLEDASHLVPALHGCVLRLPLQPPRLPQHHRLHVGESEGTQTSIRLPTATTNRCCLSFSPFLSPSPFPLSKTLLSTYGMRDGGGGGEGGKESKSAFFLLRFSLGDVLSPGKREEASSSSSSIGASLLPPPEGPPPLLLLGVPLCGRRWAKGGRSTAVGGSQFEGGGGGGGQKWAETRRGDRPKKERKGMEA